MSTGVRKGRFSEWRLILSIGAVYTLLQGVTLLRIYWQLHSEGLSPNLPALLEERAVAFVIALIYIIIIVRTTRRFLMENISWRRIIVIHLFFAFLISLLWYSTFIAVSKWLCPAGDCGGTRRELLYWYLINFDKIFLVYLFTVSVTYTYYYVKRDGINQVQRSKMENQLLQTRLQALKSQLHPHFLFNTLNSIASLIDLDHSRAKTMIADLGDLLRHVLDSKDVQFVRLKEEIDLLEKYLSIEKTRFVDDLEVRMDLEPGVEPAFLPGLILQPLVENAIRHGYSRHNPQLHIDIRASRRDDRLIITIDDNGKGIPEKKRKNIFHRGTGLSNTFERLRSIYGEDAIFTVTNRHPGVRNYLELPFIGSADTNATLYGTHADHR